MEKSRCLLCFTCVINVLRLTCVSGTIVKPGGIWTIIYLIYRKVFITTPPNFQNQYEKKAYSQPKLRFQEIC